MIGRQLEIQTFEKIRVKGSNSTAHISNKRKNVPSAKENKKTIHADNNAEYTLSHLWYIFTELCVFVTTKIQDLT